MGLHGGILGIIELVHYVQVLGPWLALLGGVSEDIMFDHRPLHWEGSTEKIELMH